ncbi:hypothetical protein BC835DRAFT_1075248 [Cytidiella melzeri]|nr:hypothetical protein BC835DRAFT_1075248 [Cytidiella melzeri]
MPSVRPLTIIKHSSTQNIALPDLEHLKTPTFFADDVYTPIKPVTHLNIVKKSPVKISRHYKSLKATNFLAANVDHHPIPAFPFHTAHNPPTTPTSARPPFTPTGMSGTRRTLQRVPRFRNAAEMHQQSLASPNPKLHINTTSLNTSFSSKATYKPEDEEDAFFFSSDDDSCPSLTNSPSTTTESTLYSPCESESDDEFMANMPVFSPVTFQETETDSDEFKFEDNGAGVQTHKAEPFADLHDMVFSMIVEGALEQCK